MKALPIEALNLFLDKTCDVAKLPGLGGVITDSRGEPLYLGVTGKRKWDAEPPLAPTDKFHLGSCTKSMTATLAMLLVEEGRISAETTIGEIFHDMTIAPEFRAVTLAQLLAHRGGVVGDLSKRPVWRKLWEMTARGEDSVREQREFFVQEIIREPPVSKPGDRYEYTNGGYMIAGAMLERVMGESWETLIKSRLFDPLGMASAGFGAPAQAGLIDEPWGHTSNCGSWVPVEPGLQADNPPALGPAGTVRCDLADLAKYMAFHLQDKRERTALPLSRESRAQLHSPWPGGDYNNGWLFARRSWAGGRALTHSGSNTMFYAVMWLAPKRISPSRRRRTPREQKRSARAMRWRRRRSSGVSDQTGWRRFRVDRSSSLAEKRAAYHPAGYTELLSVCPSCFASLQG